MSTITKTCKKEFTGVINQFVKAFPEEFNKKELKTVKKVIPLVAKLFADKISPKEEKKLVKKIGKKQIGNINIKIEIANKTREYHFKGTKVEVGTVDFSRKNETVAAKTTFDGNDFQHQFSVKKK